MVDVSEKYGSVCKRFFSKEVFASKQLWRVLCLAMRDYHGDRYKQVRQGKEGPLRWQGALYYVLLCSQHRRVGVDKDGLLFRVILRYGELHHLHVMRVTWFDDGGLYFSMVGEELGEGVYED